MQTLFFRVNMSNVHSPLGVNYFPPRTTRKSRNKQELMGKQEPEQTLVN